jgi:hypothetical protein
METDTPNFDGHSPAHHRWFQTARGLRSDDPATDTATDSATADTGLACALVPDITLSLPFESPTCNLCLQGQGNCILFNTNNALQHAQIHHREANILFVFSHCKKEYKSKHTALCHIPKCPGQRSPMNSDVRCDLWHQKFRTQRGLSQHERKAHHLVRNKERQEAAQPVSPRPTAKGYGKTWNKEQIDLM